MKYNSTRNRSVSVSAAQAIAQGISADGGLFVPESLPQYSYEDLCKLKAVSYTHLFVPKPHTPFQWEAQDTIEMLERKQKHLKENITSKKISAHWHDARTSTLEGVFARGDRRLGKVLALALSLIHI